eukprot:gene17175-biopygen18857
MRIWGFQKWWSVREQLGRPPKTGGLQEGALPPLYLAPREHLGQTRSKVVPCKAAREKAMMQWSVKVVWQTGLVEVEVEPGGEPPLPNTPGCSVQHFSKIW